MSQADIVIKLRFANTVERDQFITTHFPDRRCLESPGDFGVTGWGCFVVFCETVTLFPDAALVRKVNRVKPS